MRDAVSGRDLPCNIFFQPNPFSSFAGDVSRTDRKDDRQTNKQTNSKLNSPPPINSQTVFDSLVTSQLDGGVASVADGQPSTQMSGDE